MITEKVNAPIIRFHVQTIEKETSKKCSNYDATIFLKK